MMPAVDPRETPSNHRDLLVARVIVLAPVVLCFPVGAYAVFGAGADRDAAADGIAWVYSVGLFLSFTTSLWPLPSIRAWSAHRRARSASLLFLGMSYFTHLTWELGWLLLHPAIRGAREAAWAYPWWAYIDGGDARYATAPPELLGMEVLSVINGVVGVTALMALLKRQNARAVLVLMATSVVHLYSASLYYLTEIVAGLPNVDTSSFTDTYIKFGLANAPWVVMPFVVMWWGSRAITDGSPP